MRTLSPGAVSRYRRAMLRPHKIRSAADALRFINRLGFCYAFTAGPGGLPGLLDHLQAYREGRLSALAKAVYEQILADGPLSTWALRRRFVARGESGARFHRALDDLQEKFLVAKVGEESEWRNGFIWNAFHRWMPHVVKSAARLRSDRAAAAVLERYLVAVGVARADDIAALFGWTANSIARAAEHASVHTIQFRGQPAWATPGLVRGAPVSAEG